MEDRYPSAGRAWYMTAVLLLVTALGYLDRQVMSLLVVPVQNDLGLSDSQFGLILGPAFMIFYVFAGLPVGALADRYSRRNILLTGVVIWSSATIAAGLAQSFEALFLARALVGLGEAALIPCIFSMVADCFPPEKRGRASSIVTLGVPLGAGTALFGGGVLLAAALQIETLSWPVLGPLKAWQIVLIACGLPGLLAIALILTIREPGRHGEQKIRLADAPTGSFNAFIRRNGVTVAGVLTAYILFTFMQYGITAWLPTMLTRSHGFDPPQAALVVGAVVLTVSPAAALTGGFLGDLMARRRQDGRFRMAGLSALAFLPGVLLATLGSYIAAVVTGIVILNFSGGIIGTSVYAAFQDLAPRPFRGRMLALYATLGNLIGLGLAPWVIALVTDNVFADQAMLQWSLVVVCVPSTIISLICFFGASAGFARMRGEAEEADRIATPF